MKRGRKPKTLQMDMVIQAVQKGCTYKLAASAAGVSESSVYRWIREGEAGKRPYKNFLERIRSAEHERAASLLDMVYQAGNKDWRSAAWFLERRYGYRKDAPLDEVKEDKPPVAVDVDARTLLVTQSSELQMAMNKASQAHSWQAYAALQRQFVSVIEQIRQIDADSGANDALLNMTDEQILSEMEAAVLSMPPVLRQRLQQRIQDTAKVIPLNAKG
jgi:AcrR family transcriptional regulator